ncbi:TniB family NTP-binding protein [Roseateles sp.]|uniref:TniB family NTP-binding protein n=1 Tax=Roseateles sp. TaxID=1971397 RepID=UPI0032659054
MTATAEPAHRGADSAQPFSHIHPEFREVMSCPDEQRLAFLDRPRWIGYERAQLALDTMQALMNKPRQPRMPNLLIVGEPNNGKTTLVQRFKTLCGEGYVNENADPVKPVIVAEAPPSADEKGLYISILERFWAPYRATAPAAQLRYQVVHQLRECHVRILLIDEFHSLLTGSALKQREVMNAIKLLCNEVGIPIVGVGTRDAVRVLHTDPQHASRFDVFALPLWELDPSFQKLLAGFERVLPLKKSSGLATPDLATMAHAICGGNLGDLHRLLSACARVAITTGEERITEKILRSKAWLQPTKGIREVMA